jgi:hypothetical protein
MKKKALGNFTGISQDRGQEKSQKIYEPLLLIKTFLMRALFTKFITMDKYL